MKLWVHIACPDCGESTEIHVLGGWDIKRVLHECEGGLGQTVVPGRERRNDRFAVEFDPPRRTF